jgi:hypothetical protein
MPGAQKIPTTRMLFQVVGYQLLALLGSEATVKK